MKIVNPERERVASRATPEELAEALQALDLESIPNELRPLAVLDRIMKVMVETSPMTEHHKEAYQAAKETRLAISRNR